MSQPNATTNVSRTARTRLALACTIVMAPILGCGSDSDVAGQRGSGPVVHGAAAVSVTDDAPTTVLGDAWNFVVKTTDTGLTVVSEKCAEGSNIVVNASNVVWIRSVDATTDGWEWIVENAGNPTEWARDAATETWTITQQKSGEFSMWVQVKTSDGAA